MTRTYDIRLSDGRRMSRDLPATHALARMIVAGLAQRKGLWLGSTWMAEDGHAIRITEDGEVKE